jgi:hypothetical protein
MAAGFAEGGAADVLAPGAELAGLVTAVTGPDGTRLGTLTDPQTQVRARRRHCAKPPSAHGRKTQGRGRETAQGLPDPRPALQAIATQVAHA